MEEINDIRNEQDFKIITFSGFKKTEVMRELLKSLIKGKIESACYWCVDLICSGKYCELWELILLFYGKYIHLANPKIILYLDRKFQVFKNILTNGYLGDDLKLRNNIKIRELFSEIMVLLCSSRRKYMLNDIKINREDFDITVIRDKFKAPNANYCDIILKENDPKSLTFSVNELAYSITEDIKNLQHACYWVEWIIQYGKLCDKNKEKCRIEERDYLSIDSKETTNIIWIVWDVLMQEAKKRDAITIKMIEGLLSIFSIRYMNTLNAKRRNLLYCAVSFLTEDVDYKKELMEMKQKEVLTQIVSNINSIYKQIKTNEVRPTIDKLSNIDNSNLSKTQQKLATMNEFSDKYIPRL